jgi:hypothetical protein
MEGRTRFLDCPAYVGSNPAARCGLPAELEAQYMIGSTGWPLECVRIRCPRGHWFNGTVESLAIPHPPAVAPVSRALVPPPHIHISHHGRAGRGYVARQGQNGETGRCG